MPKLGLIAGNGRFPFLLLDAARAHGLTVVVAAIKEETDPEIDARAAADSDIHVHWLSLGELSRLIETFQAEGVTRAVMAGQVKHKQIFSSIRPDWRLAKLLLNLRTRSTDMLLGAVAKVLGDEGIELISSTQYLEPLLAKPGVLTTRRSGRRRTKGHRLRPNRRPGHRRLRPRPDRCHRRPGLRRRRSHGRHRRHHRPRRRTLPHLRQTPPTALPGDHPPPHLTVVKVAKPNQDMRFDVPVIGVATIRTMQAAGATCLAVEAGKTLLFDPAAILAAANQANIAIVAM